MKDLNAILNKLKIICGSARSMGIEVKEYYEKKSKRYKEILKNSITDKKIGAKEV